MSSHVSDLFSGLNRSGAVPTAGCWRNNQTVALAGWIKNGASSSSRANELAAFIKKKRNRKMATALKICVRKSSSLADSS